jgi:hypothetical protein
MCGKHKALLASDASLYPEAQLFQLSPDSQAETGLTRVDQDGDCRGGCQEARDIGQGGLESLQRVLPRDQADAVFCPWKAACRRRSHMIKSASAEREGYFQAIGAGNDGPMSIRQASEIDHGVDDLLAAGTGIRLKHFDLPNGGHLSCDAALKRLATHVELDFARQLDDCLGVMTILEKREFDGLRAVDEQAAIETVLFLGDPVAAPVLADEDDW